MSYAKSKGRGTSKSEFQKSLNGNTFTALRHDVINSEEFTALSLSAKWVFIKLCASYNKFNNGDLIAPQDKAKDLFGLSSRTLKTALDELVTTKFLEVVRQGGKNQCTLYAITCYKFNTIKKGNAVILEETSRPLDSWKKSAILPTCLFFPIFFVITQKINEYMAIIYIS